MSGKRERKLKLKTRAKPPLHELIADAIASRRFFYSFEYSAARDPDPDELQARIARMASLRPLFVDASGKALIVCTPLNGCPNTLYLLPQVTWGFGGQATGRGTIEAARRIHRELGVPVLMHLICTEMTYATVWGPWTAPRLSPTAAVARRRRRLSSFGATAQQLSSGCPQRAQQRGEADGSLGGGRAGRLPILCRWLVGAVRRPRRLQRQRLGHLVRDFCPHARIAIDIRAETHPHFRPRDDSPLSQNFPGLHRETRGPSILPNCCLIAA